MEDIENTPPPETHTTGYRNENWKTDDAELESALDAFWNVAYTQGHDQRGHDDEAGTAQKADDELRRVIASRAAPSSDKQLEPLKPLLATRFKLSFDGKGRCTTFRKDQAEKLFGEWVWLIEATDGMNSTLYAAPAPETRALGGDDLDPKALKEAKIAYDQKYADMSGPYPTEEPDAGDGPLGYAIRAYLKSLVPAIPLSLTQSLERSEADIPPSQSREMGI